MYHHLGLSVGAIDALVVRVLLMTLDLPRNPHTHTVYPGRLLVSAGGLTQLSAAAIASFPFVCVLAGSIQNGKPLYCGKLGVSVDPPGALKARRLTGRPWCCA